VAPNKPVTQITEVKEYVADPGLPRYWACQVPAASGRRHPRQRDAAPAPSAGRETGGSIPSKIVPAASVR